MKFFNVFVIFLSLVLISCAREGVEIERHKYTAEEERRVAKYGEGVLEAQDKWEKAFARLLGNDTSVDASTVNNILWSTALDKISFMPLSDVDKISGVIITDWYTINSNNSDQKIKINIFVKNNVINPESLDVKVFQEHLIDGVWKQANRNEDLELKIKDSILNTATRLQLASENL